MSDAPLSQARWCSLGLSVLLVGLVGAAWFVFAPPILGGSTLYSHTVGASMEPLFRTGDVAVVRRASSYRVGEIALYESSTLNEKVLHRIVAIRGGRYFFKGDNNSAADPGFATREQLVGVLWFRIPGFPRDLAWIQGKVGRDAFGLLAVVLAVLVVVAVLRERANFGPSVWR